MGSWVCTGDSKSLLVHICSDLGRRDKGRGPGGFAAALLEGEEDGEGRGGRAREGRVWPRMAVPEVSGLGMSQHLV